MRNSHQESENINHIIMVVGYFNITKRTGIQVRSQGMLSRKS